MTSLLHLARVDRREVCVRRSLPLYYPLSHIYTIVVECSHADSLVWSSRTFEVCSSFVLLATPSSYRTCHSLPILYHDHYKFMHTFFHHSFSFLSYLFVSTDLFLLLLLLLLFLIFFLLVIVLFLLHFNLFISSYPFSPLPSPPPNPPRSLLSSASVLLTSLSPVDELPLVLPTQIYTVASSKCLQTSLSCK